MATALSDEEFQRMQTQLLELRTKNYNLGEKNVKIQSELLQNNQLLDDLRKELAKCQKIVSRSRNAKEVEQLIQENEALQGKLQMQEDEFRLQNETLMQEVSNLISQNEKLTQELELMKSGHLSSSEMQNEDIMKLEAENAALKKLMNNSIESKESDDDFEKKTESLLEVSTLLEEKKLLQANMKKLENEYKEQFLKIQMENEKNIEKLKKKQESFLRLQEEKEKLYEETQLTIKKLQNSKESEIKNLKDQILCMQTDLKEALQFNEHIVSNEADEMSDVVVEIEGGKATFDCSFNETKVSLLNIQNKIKVLNHQLQESENNKKILETDNEELKLKLEDLEKLNLELEKSLQEQSKLAETRKQLMDTMKNHLLETTNKHSSEIENLTRQLADEQDKLQKLFDKEKETEAKLIESRNEVQVLRDEIERLKSDCFRSDGNVKQLDEQLKKKTVEFENLLSEKENEHTSVMETLKQEMENTIKDLIIQLEVSKAEKAEFEDKVKVLQQEAKDFVDERKIQEKKGLSMVKDLKRQLQVERNRAEKLQERLQEVLSSEQNRSVDEILQASSDKGKGDTSSISSWSYVSGGTAERENATLHSDTSSGGHDSPNRVSPTMLETETNSLIAKVAELQQKNSNLAEKVSHLEMSNEALVDDVLRKTALIQFYCMEGRSDPHSSGTQDKLTIKRIVDFIKDRGDENLKEINRRMQRLLEETLTKNMHLQNDIEILSNEVSRLSKLVNSPVENGLQNSLSVDSA